jgi:hypothetical protein
MQEGQFTLFKNNKTTNNAPYYIGEGMYKGEKLRLACWVKEGKNGKYLSGKISEPLPPRTQDDDSQGTGDLPF